ncbi:pathogenesis-related homeodomain protein-like protein [Carex littledalei]|uniref:Pathogenesis-related homeodomain protein-like protein n=1 Tax=Carex littledalei TaxID=544730 RepID=A0A833QI70_9POAL|nr:pathogenesis-related homeodomain protein-like protein [Carex littledalei]
MGISQCKPHSSVKSFPKKRVALKRKNEKERNEIVKSGRKKNQRKLGKCDEVTRLQRRARYLLIKIKLEKNLLEAYYADGWKGQSREKIKPEKELERAEKEIIKCKLGIREIIRELDLFISTCQCGSHQNCLESPAKVPGADHKRLCKYDENKIIIIEATNAHLCTSFSIDSSYVDIFKEEAANPEGKDLKFKDEKEWPSDESEDEDYNPELNEVTCSSGNETEETDSEKFDLSNSSTCNSHSDKINFGEAGECETMHRPRQRKYVDYMKLHDEMFGKDAQHVDESEDEEWGPHVRQKSRKKANEDQFMVVNSTSDANILDDDVPAHMSKYSRIPPSAVKELQKAFARNELPSRSVKDNLSKLLGLSQKKVDLWFKNARYAALKLRKASTPNCEGKKRKSDEAMLLDASCFIPLSELIHVSKRSGCNLERDRTSKKKIVQDKVPTSRNTFHEKHNEGNMFT